MTQGSLQKSRAIVLREALAGRFLLRDCDPICSSAIVSIADVRPGRQNFRVTLTDPAAARGVERTPSESAVWTFAMRSREALAMLTMYFLSDRDPVTNEPRYLWGGLHYLQGEPDLFWSMVVYYLRTGQPLPPPLTASRDAATEAWEVGAPFRDAVPPSDYLALAADYQAQFDAATSGDVLCMWHYKQTGCSVRACPGMHPPRRQRPAPRTPFQMPQRCIIELSRRTAGSSRMSATPVFNTPGTDTPEMRAQVAALIAQFKEAGGDMGALLSEGAGEEEEADEAKRRALFPVGARVVLHSLSATAFNGLSGEIVSEFAMATLRCGVRLDPPSGAVKQIRLANLRREALTPFAATVDTRVVLHSLKSAPRFNGLRGKIIAPLNATTQRVDVCIDGGSDVKQLRLNNLAHDERVKGAASIMNRHREGHERATGVGGGSVALGLNYDVCSGCGATEGPFRMCGGCRNVNYCSTACQKKSWPSHKPRCAAHKAQRKRAKAKAKAEAKMGGKRRPQPANHMYCAATGVGHVSLIRATGDDGVPQCTVSCAWHDDLKGTAGVPPSAKWTKKFSTLDELARTPGSHGAHTACLLACGPMKDLPFLTRALESGLIAARDVARLELQGAGFTPLDWAARCGNFEIAEFLLSVAPELARLGTPVGWACYTNRVKLARMLVEHGASDRATSRTLFHGRSPLAVAAENAQLLAMKWCVEERGYDVRRSGVLRYIAAGGAIPGGRGEMTPMAEKCKRWALEQGALN